MKIVQFPIERDSDGALHARRARMLAALADLTRRQRVNLGKAVSEACRHVISDGGRGAIEFGISSTSSGQFVEVVVTQNSKRTDLSNTNSLATQPRETSSLQRIGEFVDRFRLDGEPGGETIIRMSQIVSAGKLPADEEQVSQWAEVLEQKAVEEALTITERRNRTLTGELSQREGQEQLQHQLEADATADETTVLLSLVASKTDNAVIILDGDGKIDWVNEAFTIMTGYGSVDVAEKSLGECLFGPKTDANSVHELNAAIEQGHGINEEYLIYRNDGQTRWTQWNVTPVRDEHGQVSRWIAIGSDITRRRQAQEALQSAKDAAELANRAKSQFLANMSHEIRTPMNAIIGMTDLALGADIPQEVRDYLSTVKLSAESLLELLNDILDLSKIEAGRMEIESIDFNLPDLVQSTLKALDVKAKDKGLQLLSNWPANVPPELCGDPVRLRQVLVNLVGNAIKFTERGEVEVAIEKQWESAQELGLHFSVRDTGIGIPTDRLERIFEAFTQVDSFIARNYGGTGLGLTITAELLHLMRGRIWVESEVGRGSTFHFSLRFKRATAVPDMQDQSHAADTAVAQTARPLKVLIADDHGANRELAAKILEKRGHQCSHAADGNEVLTALEHDEFDITLLDIQMPNLDGYQTTTAIRQREQETGTHLPIIALTAHAMQGVREKCLEAGMDSYLPKPLQARELYTLVESIGAATPATERTTLEPVPLETSLDLSAALARLEGDVELLKDQMIYFVNDAPKILEQIRQAISDSDARALHITAHRLKGLVATYDADAATELALKLEVMGRDDAIDGADSVFNELRTAVNDLSTNMSQFIAGGE